LSEIEAVKIFLSPTSPLTPSVLRHRVEELAVRVTAVEKGYGVILKGRKADVEACVFELRKLDPTGIFVRKSGPPLKTQPVFRGFLQAAAEYSLLPQFSRALAETVNAQGPTSPQQGLRVEGSGEAVVYAVEQGIVKFWVCRDAVSREVVAACGSKQTAVREARRRGYRTIREASSRTSPAAPTSAPVVCGIMVMCRCWPETLVEAVVKLHSDDNVSVRCPLGEVCGARCPYGRVEPWAFSPYCSGAYLTTKTTGYVPSR